MPNNQSQMSIEAQTRSIDFCPCAIIIDSGHVRQENQKGARQVDNAESPRASSTAAHPPAQHLAIYIATHCEICQYALEVADEIRRAYPQVDVQVVDINQTTEAVPESVFATPTYLLNGRVWSLGNPSITKVREAFGAPAQAG